MKNTTHQPFKQKGTGPTDKSGLYGLMTSLMFTLSLRKFRLFYFFCSGYSTMDSIFASHTIIEIAKTQKKNVFCSFIDLFCMTSWVMIETISL